MPDFPPSYRGGTRTKRERGLAHDRKRRHSQEWRGWYKLAIWHKQIRPQQLAAHPLCARCLAEGMVTAASIVNHVGGHGGSFERFIGGPFESICKPHHDGDVKREEMKAKR